ncbi:MAG: hypothetical protein KJ052_11675 [Candidatus Hydrogenedentes bacterium]|nr:hypothetical protein [Candidatus Hydrogenedentota bacterium]
MLSMSCRNLLVILALAALPVRAETDALKLDLTLGESYQQTIESHQTITQTIGANEQERTQAMLVELRYEVKEKDPAGLMTCKVAFERLKTEAGNGVESTEYDSAAEGVSMPVIYKPYAGLIGQAFTASITPLGRVREVKGMSEIIDAAVDTMDMAPEQKWQLAGIIQSQFGNEAMQKLIEQTLAVFPDETVAPGGAWSNEVETVGMAALRLKNTFTLDAIEDTAKITQTGELLPGAEETIIDMSGFEMESKMSGTQTGTFVLDARTGWILSSAATQKLSGEMTTTLTDPATTKKRAIHIPMTIVTELRVSDPAAPTNPGQ